QDGIVLTAAGENIDDLADFKIASQDGVEFALLGILREVDRKLIEIGSLAAHAATAGWGTTGLGSRTGRGFTEVVGIFAGSRGDLLEVLLKGVGVDLLQFLAGLADDASEFL